MDAIVSGSANIALAIDADHVWSLRRTTSSVERLPQQLRDLRYLLGDAQDLVFLEDVDEAAILAELDLAHSGVKALHLALMLCDPHTLERAAGLGAEAFAALIVCRDVAERVERILDAKPIPTPLDLAKAAMRCRHFKREQAARFFDELAMRQPSIREIRRAWEALPPSSFPSEADRIFIDGLLAREGFFRSLVHVREEGADVDHWLARTLQDPVVIRWHAQHWVEAWVASLATTARGPQLAEMSYHTSGLIQGTVPGSTNDSMPELALNGLIYRGFTADATKFRSEDHTCIRRTVERLLWTTTTADRPGMLLGKIQSGKTKTFLGVVALAFDNGVDIAVIFTKGTKALSRQTVTRVKTDFAPFIKQDRMQVFDVMEVPATLTGYELNQKLVFVAKKQQDNLKRLRALFETKYPKLKNKKVLLIDDEADYASIGFKRSKEEGIEINRTTKQLNELRALLPQSVFLQVTATPYSLYLQPDDLQIGGIEFHAVRPAFTELVPVHPDYIGSDYYFEQGAAPGTVASCLFEPVTRDELEILGSSDRRRFKPEDCLDSNAVKVFRSALCNFIVGGCIRRLQDEDQGRPPRKFSFLFHTEAQKAAHSHQEDVVRAFSDKLLEAATQRPDRLKELFGEAYDDLKVSIDLKKHLLPRRDRVIQESIRALTDDWLMVTKVNSENQINELLDENGQLRLRTPLNLYIGGQILDRGVTIANLIGFFYGRRPNVYQQDTVLQHSRMFGFRPAEDLTVTRFYTEPTIYNAIRRMHESDVALRESIIRNPSQPVVFIQQDPRGKIVACSPNKILVSKTTTLAPFKRILPVGFQTDFKTRVAPIVKDIDALIAEHRPSESPAVPFMIPLEMATAILTQIEPTLISEPGYEFEWKAARAALEYMSHSSVNESHRGSVWCLVRTDRNANRFVEGPRQAYYDSPDTGQREGVIARDVAIDIPMLMLFRQNGAEAQGWRGTPFYWPVIFTPKNVKTAIFAQEAMA